MPSLAIKSPSRRPPSSRHVFHCCRATSSIATVTIAATAAPSIAVAPSIAAAPSIAIAPSIAVAAVNVALRLRFLSPLRCRPAVHRVASPSHHPSPLPLRRHRAPFPLLLLVDCCLFIPPQLLSRLPLPLPSSTLRHHCVVLGEAIFFAVVVIIVLPSASPPP